MLFRIIYEDKASTFEKLLEKDSSVSIHARNLCLLAVEMFKVVKGLALTIINDLFPLKETNNYNLRRKVFFKIPRNETVRNCFESIWSYFVLSVPKRDVITHLKT